MLFKSQINSKEMFYLDTRPENIASWDTTAGETKFIFLSKQAEKREKRKVTSLGELLSSAFQQQSLRAFPLELRWGAQTTSHRGLAPSGSKADDARQLPSPRKWTRFHGVGAKRGGIIRSFFTGRKRKIPETCRVEISLPENRLPAEVGLIFAEQQRLGWNFSETHRPFPHFPVRVSGFTASGNLLERSKRSLIFSQFWGSWGFNIVWIMIDNCLFILICIN